MFAPPKQRTGIAVSVLLLAVVAVVVGVTVILTTGGHGDTPTAAPPPVTPRSAPTVPSDPLPSYASPKPLAVQPLIAGWQAVATDRDGVAYDVPPDWQVLSPGTIAGYESANGDPEVLMHTVADYRHDFCPAERGSTRAQVGFITPQDPSPPTQARDAVRAWAAAAAEGDDGTRPAVTVSTPRRVAVDGGKLTATVYTATAPMADPDTCQAPLVKVTVAALSKPDGTPALFVAVTDEQVPDALPDSVLGQVVASLRPVAG